MVRSRSAAPSTDGSSRPFPTKGDWTRQAVWADPTLAHILEGQQLARKLSERREQVALLLERAAGPVLHNSTRGDALLPNAGRYGPFLAEWGAIYERFGVPADIGLAQVILESGLNGTRRSEANAVGFCQWLQRNWKRLNHFSPTPIEGRNQTTQAPYCAAYLSVLATKYGSFIPALSEHNAGGTNVGRTLINGEHLGAEDVRARYFLGSKLARDLRALPGREYEDVYRSYGPRSYLYAEMVFGNTFNVRRLIASTPQTVDPRDAHAARDFAGRDRQANGSLRGRGAPVQSGTRRSGAGARRRSTFRTTSASLVLTWRSGAGRPARRMWPFWMTSCASTPALNSGTIRPSRLS